MINRLGKNLSNLHFYEGIQRWKELVQNIIHEEEFIQDRLLHLEKVPARVTAKVPGCGDEYY